MPGCAYPRLAEIADEMDVSDSSPRPVARAIIDDNR
jgi:hypothetical protein